MEFYKCQGCGKMVESSKAFCECGCIPDRHTRPFVKCECCGQFYSSESANVVRLRLTNERYDNGATVRTDCKTAYGDRIICINCSNKFLNYHVSVVEILDAIMEKRLIVAPQRVPELGNRLWEVVDDTGYPLVENVVTRASGAIFEAKAINNPDAGIIQFSINDLGDTLFWSKKEALAKQKSLKEEHRYV